MSIVRVSECDTHAMIVTRINVPVTWMIFLIFGGTIIGICLNSLIFLLCVYCFRRFDCCRLALYFYVLNWNRN